MTKRVLSFILALVCLLAVGAALAADVSFKATLTFKPADNAPADYFTGQAASPYLWLNIETNSQELAGSTVVITVPSTYLNADTGLTVAPVNDPAAGVASTVTVDTADGNHRATITFTQLPKTINLGFPLTVKTVTYTTPDGYQLPLSATFTPNGGTAVTSEGFFIPYKTSKPNPYQTGIMLDKLTLSDNLTVYGGRAAQGNTAYIGEGSSAAPVLFGIEFKNPGPITVNGVRNYAQVSHVVTMPTYTDVNGATRTAAFDPAINPGWELIDGKPTFVYNEKVSYLSISTHTSSPYYGTHLFNGLPLLRLTFPGAPTGTDLTQTWQTTFTPENPGVGEQPVVIKDSHIFRLDNKVPAANLLKDEPAPMIDQMTAKQELALWPITAKSTSMDISGFVLEDFGLSPEMQFDSLRLYYMGPTVLAGTAEGGRGTVTVEQKLGGVWAPVAGAQGILTSLRVIALDPLAEGVRVKADTGTVLRGNQTFQVDVRTKLRDPANTIYNADTMFKFVNSAKVTGAYSNGEPLPTGADYTSNQLQRFLPYTPTLWASKTAGTGSLTDGQSASFTLGLHTSKESQRIFAGEVLKQPVIIMDLLPAGMEYDDASPPTVTIDGTSNLGKIDATPEVIDNYQGTGRTALIWTSTDDILVERTVNDNWRLINITYKAKATPLMASGNSLNEVYMTWDNNAPGTAAQVQQIGLTLGTSADAFDLDKDGDKAERVLRTTENVQFLPPQMFYGYKQTKGSLDSVATLRGAKTTVGAWAAYELTQFNNQKGMPVTALSTMDILPRQGDANGSQYNVYLAGAVSIPAAYQGLYEVHYSTQPAEGTAAFMRSETAWGPLPEDLSQVTAVRIRLIGTMPEGAKHTYTVPVVVDNDPAIKDGAMSYNQMYTDLGAADLTKPEISDLQVLVDTVEATKVWANLDQATAQKITDTYAGRGPALDPYLDVWFQLYRTPEGGEPAPVAGVDILRVPFPMENGQVPAPGAEGYQTTVIWPSVPAANGNYTYSVREVDANGKLLTLGNFTKLEVGLRVTNTYFPTLSGLKRDDPCGFEWYVEAIADRTGKDWGNTNYTYKVGKSYFPAHKGKMMVQHFGNPTLWRVPIATDYPITNGEIKVDVSDYLGVAGDTYSDIRIVLDNTVFVQSDYDWFNHSSPHGETYILRNDLLGTPQLSADGKTLTIPVPYLPANSAVLVQFQSDRPLPVGARSVMGVTFQGDYHCLTTQKAWLGEQTPPDAVTFNLTPEAPLTRQSALQAMGLAEQGAAEDRVFHIVRQSDGQVRSDELRGWAREVTRVYPEFAALIQPVMQAAFTNWPLPPAAEQQIDDLEKTVTLTAEQLNQMAYALVTAYNTPQQQVLTANTEGIYQHTWGNLPMDEVDGQLVKRTYTVSEEPVPGFVQVGYLEEVDASGKTHITLTNAPAVSLTVTKEWVNDTGMANPDSVQVELLQNGAPLTPAVTAQLNAGNQWTYTFEGLVEADDQGAAYTYTVAETVPTEYQATQTVDPTTGAVQLVNTRIVRPTAAPLPTDPPAPTYPTLQVPLTAKKVLKNGTLKAGDYTFVLKDAKGNVLAEVGNFQDGTIVFPNRTFSRAVTNYTYTITEKAGQDSKVTYDATVYTVKITTTPQSGALKAKVDILKDGTPYAGDMVFTNVRKMPPTGDSMPFTMALLAMTALALFGGAMLLKRRPKEQ